jgi:putative hydrolase of the HAD superfamily
VPLPPSPTAGSPTPVSGIAAVKLVFFDIGGVLGTNGWDTEQRRTAAARYALDEADLTRRHKEVADAWETGRMSFDEYLDVTVFHTPRAFGKTEFRQYMLELSAPWEDSVAVVRDLAAAGRVRLYTLNNESEELNRHRIARFGLHGLFEAFLSSCWLGVRKPSRLIYQRAFAIADADPGRSLFVDDREPNLEPARALGCATHLFTGAPALRAAVAPLLAPRQAVLPSGATECNSR